MQLHWWEGGCLGVRADPRVFGITGQQGLKSAVRVRSHAGAMHRTCSGRAANFTPFTLFALLAVLQCWLHLHLRRAMGLVVTQAWSDAAGEQKGGAVTFPAWHGA